MLQAYRMLFIDFNVLRFEQESDIRYQPIIFDFRTKTGGKYNKGVSSFPLSFLSKTLLKLSW